MLGARIQSAVRMNDDPCGLDADTGFERCCYLCCYLVIRLWIIGGFFDLHRILVGEVFLKDTDEIFACYALMLTYNSLNIAGKYIDSRNDDIIGKRGSIIEAAQ